MNNRGWGLSDMLAICSVLAFALLVAVIVYYNTFGDVKETEIPTLDVSNYAALELKAENAAYSYVADNNIKTDTEIQIKIDDLLVEGYLHEFYDNEKQSCTGYVNYDGISYSAYIKCGSNYTTSGYISDLDE